MVFTQFFVTSFILPETFSTLNDRKIEVPLDYPRKECFTWCSLFTVNFNQVLILSFSFQSLPASIANLHSLQSLSLHSNKLSTLPPQIVNLCLVELSLRNNPLVVNTCIHISRDPTSIEFAYSESLARTSQKTLTTFLLQTSATTSHRLQQ